jgi:hypothetical protein
METKLFKVEKWIRPEWGRSTLEYERYFLCNERSTLESVLRDRYGDLKKYYRHDECSVEYDITECEVESL